MTRSSILLALFASLASLALIGCERSSSPSASSSSSSSSTQPATTETSGGPVAVPNVGIKAFTSAAQYKPVVGKYGGRLVRDALGEPKGFNPITEGEMSTAEFTLRMFQGLTETDPFTGETRPSIATSWETAPDGLTWTFHLRKDVTFNDGSPLTAQDVIFSWNDAVYDHQRPAGKEPRWPSSSRDSMTFDRKECEFTAPDDYTVVVKTPVKVAILDQMMGDAIILSKKKYEPLVKNGTFGGAMSADSKPQDIVGSGPFMLGSYVRGESVTLKRNPHYWKKDSAGNALPYMDELYFHLVRDLQTMMLDFEQGVTDSWTLRTGKDVARLKPNENAQNFDLYQLGPDNGDLFLALNMNVDAAKKGKVAEYKVNWFRDSRFRQALSLAIDRDAQVRNIRRNLGYPEYAPQTLAPGPFRVDVPPIQRNVEKARQLLDEMGLKMGPNGVRVDAQGHEVSFTLNTNAGNDTREQACDFIRKDLEQIGVKVNTLYLEFNLLVDKMDVNFDWEALVMALTGSTEPHWGSNIWKSSGRLHMWWPEQKTPGFDWEKQIDDVYLTGIQEMDKEKRKAIYKKWVEIAYREQPFVYLTVPERVVAVRRRFGNLAPGTQGPVADFAMFNNEDEIFVTAPPAK
jgi:peptide/nickel transport system substrate-binding protein